MTICTSKDISSFLIFPHSRTSHSSFFTKNHSLFPCDDYCILDTLSKITVFYFAHFPFCMITYSSSKTYQEILRSPKMRIFLIFSLAAYALIFFRLLGSFLVFESMIYVMIFFIFFHFLYLEIRKIPIMYLWIGMIILT